ncbi:glycerol-3-phosphate acyltransferase [Chloroflexota bacterium]
MEIYYSILLAVSAFWLGACPFSVWIGRWFLGKDIRDYGDGNPGATNVHRAGGRKSYYLAVFLGLVKGAPFVVLVYKFFGFHEAIVLAVALSAILGNVFSPLLRLKGGKSIGVTFSTLFVLPQHDILLTFIIFLLVGFLFIEIDAWIVIFGAAGSLLYLVATRGSSWESLFMLCVLAIFVAKHFNELQTVPGLSERLIHWVQSRRREI